MPPPKFATARDLSRPTHGTRQAAFARVWLGNSFMPAQQLIADVAGEVLPNGRPAYPLVIVTEPRRAGKSHLAMAQIGERCFSVPGFHSWYTSQSGTDATLEFTKFVTETIAGQPLQAVVKPLLGAGREVLKFPNLSWMRPHPPTEEKLHGKESDRNDIDEAWAFTEEQGKLLMQAIAPTQLTRPGAQTFIWSAGGTAKSTWLARLVARGREGDPSIAYFEWGIPDDADPEDLDVIAANHPAFGHTIDMDSLRSLRLNFDDDVAGWARAAGNRWTEIIGGAIPKDLWKGARHLDPIPDGATVGYGAATSADRTETVVVAAAKVGGLVVGEVLDVIHNPYGAAPRVAAWATDGPLAVDSRGPSASLADALKDFPRMMPIGTPEATAAAANMLDGLRAGVVKARQHPSLDAAVQVAVKRLVADGAFLWARQSAGASIAALEAFGLAAFAVGHRPVPAPRPMMRVPGE